MLEVWLRTVFSEIPKERAICLSLMPWARAFMTSSSLSVSGENPPKPLQADIASSHAHEQERTGHSAKRRQLTDLGNRARSLGVAPFGVLLCEHFVTDIAKRGVCSRLEMAFLRAD